ncbi:MAG TPA: Crp/Fnr family transcriptional regulator [Gammaproteobacteria bacterium]|nr:Crp/Fnr family transcriptional regulator [Gammaproteobacteria bacterium]
MNDHDQLARELRHHYLFSALSEAQRRHALSHVHVRSFKADELLFGQGDRAQAFFLLQSGAVKLYRVSADGQEKIMRLIRPGQSFAESIMFMDEPRYPVHGAGIEAGTLLGIERGAFLDILRESFDTARAVMAQMTQRIQAHWDEIEALTLQNGRYRAVHYLLALVPDGRHGAITVRLPTRKMLIAAHLAITPETLSRILRALSDEGLIEVHDEAVHIPDIAAFRKRMH